MLTTQALEAALAHETDAQTAITSVVDKNFEDGNIPAPREDSFTTGLLNRLGGYGFIQPYLDNDEIEEIWINEPGVVWFAKNGRHQRSALNFDSKELESVIERMIRTSGRRLDRSSPFIDAQLENGFRFHAVVPDITRRDVSINIRKFRNQTLTLADMVASGVLSNKESDYLVTRLRGGANLIISGATQSGKTTLLSALLNSLDPYERVVSVEDTFELRCTLPDWVAMQTRPASIEGKFEVDLRRLVRESLRMRPTRLVVGEVRGAEALDLLIAMNSGIPSLCTIHANSAKDALSKLRTLPLLAGNNITIGFLDAIISTSLNLIVHCVRTVDGQRRISSVMEIDSSNGLEIRDFSA
jgi:pilus assembly protein CpaF